MHLVFAILRSRVVLATVDITVAHLAYLLAFYLRFGDQVHPANAEAYRLLLPYMAAALVALFLLYDLYAESFRPWSDVASSLLISVALLSVVVVALSFYIRALAMPRTVILIGTLCQVLMLLGWRYVAWMLTRRLAPVERVLVVARTCAEARHLFGRLEGLDRPTKPLAMLLEEIGDAKEEFHGVDELPQMLERYQADAVYVGGAVSPATRRRVTELCIEKDVFIRLVPDLYEIVLSQSRLSQVWDTPVFEIGRLEPSEGTRLLKRGIDLVVSSIGLVLALPIMAVVAAIVALDSPGPIIFKQTRVTRDGRLFTMYKFRTMVHDAERETGPVMATAEDPRTTRVGRFLRTTRLDELPQLLNVVMGDMSLVGPRPERPIFVAAFSEEVAWYSHRLRVKPGLTGLAQIAGRYSTSVEDKLRYDLLYACSQSLAADIRILVKTLQTIMSRHRAS
ncbi:MAG: sugar transferase [Bacillota bacterium]